MKKHDISLEEKRIPTDYPSTGLVKKRASAHCDFLRTEHSIKSIDDLCVFKSAREKTAIIYLKK